MEAAVIKNYPGFPEGIRGLDLAARMVEQCENAGAEIHSLERVLEMELTGEGKRVKTERRTYSAASVIIATGTEHRPLEVPGEREFQGRGVSHCAVCDGPLFKGRAPAVVGGGNSAAVDALFLSNLASSVKLVHRRSSLRAENALIEEKKRNGVEFLLETEVREIVGDDRVRGVVLHNNRTGEVTEIEAYGVSSKSARCPKAKSPRRRG